MTPKKNLDKKIKKINTIPQKKLDSPKITEQEKLVWLDEYIDHISGQVRPLTNKSLQRLCSDLVNWAQKPTTLTIASYFNALGMDPKKRDDWAGRFPEFKEALRLTRSIIGQRREEMALQRQLDASTALKMMAYYDKDWRDMVEWQAQIKAKAEADNKANVIVLSELDYNKKV